MEELRFFLTDVFDLMKGNAQYITQEDFIKKYGKFDIDLDVENSIINISDERGNGWAMDFRQTFAPEPF